MDRTIDATKAFSRLREKMPRQRRMRVWIAPIENPEDPELRITNYESALSGLRVTFNYGKRLTDMKRDVIQGAVLIGAAIIIAVVSNAVASRERKLVLPGYYPGALNVPPRTTTQPAPAQPQPEPTPEPALAPESPVVTTTTTEAPKPTAIKKPEKPRSFPPHPDKPYIEIAYDDVAYLHKNGALFLDARRTSVFEQGHIAGARPFSVWESDVDEKVNNLFAERSDPTSQNQPIVVYCSGGDCEDSHMLSQKLWGVQFNNVYVYKDGYPDWQKRGGAVRTGAAR